MRRSSYEYIIPVVLALGITISLGFLIPNLSAPYQLKLEKSELVAPDFYRCYNDLDRDGNSEIIEIFYNSSGNLSVKLRHLNEGTINQFNLPGRLPKVGRMLDLQDINGDGITDIFVCTEKNDSIYLTIIDDIYKHPTSARVYALDPINQNNDNGDYTFIVGGIRDLNGDGSPEFVMAINGGHSLQPRRVYAIDYRKNTVLKSPESGAAVYSLGFFDLDRDGNDEILLNTTATDNFSEPFPYMDTTTYLMVLDKDLSFYKAPLALGENRSWSAVEPFTYNGEHFILSYVRYTGVDQNHSNLTIYDDSLRPLRSRDIHQQPRDAFGFWRESDSLGLAYMHILSREKRFKVDFNLQFSDSIRSELPLSDLKKPERRFNLDGSGKDEYVFVGENKVLVIRDDLKHSAELDVAWSHRNPRTLVSIIEKEGDKPVLVVQLEREAFYLTYNQNVWFKFRFLVYPAIFIMLFGMFYLLGNLQMRMVRRRYEKDRLISQLQLQSIKNQLDPHFTYNALNAVGSLIYKGEKDLAYQYLKGLTDLLRLVSGDASVVTWTLKDELGFVLKFLEIEKLRFREKFVYSLEVEDELNGLKLPKLSVLTFVENAIKHGLRHKSSERILKIAAEAFEGGMRISIVDNGIGRKAAAKYQEEKSGNGLEMMKKYFKQFNEAAGSKARFEIIDLFKNENEPAGTRVEIYIE
ncbi:MAG: histidine kinase [Bacteroides sp.]|nr:histidine kinase [Bacteroides sp.]